MPSRRSRRPPPTTTWSFRPPSRPDERRREDQRTPHGSCRRIGEAVAVTEEGRPEGSGRAASPFLRGARPPRRIPRRVNGSGSAFPRRDLRVSTGRPGPSVLVRG
jgi:hypothetical protein